MRTVAPSAYDAVQPLLWKATLVKFINPHVSWPSVLPSSVIAPATKPWIVTSLIVRVPWCVLPC